MTSDAFEVYIFKALGVAELQVNGGDEIGVPVASVREYKIVASLQVTGLVVVKRLIDSVVAALPRM